MSFGSFIIYEINKTQVRIQFPKYVDYIRTAETEVKFKEIATTYDEVIYDFSLIKVIDSEWIVLVSLLMKEFKNIKLIGVSEEIKDYSKVFGVIL